MKKIIAAAAASALMLSLAACTSNDEYVERKEKQNSVTLENSLGIQNLEERLKREEDPNAVRYLYLMSFGQIVGYYVTKGKISNSAAQLAPEQEVIRYYGEPNILDSAKDDGTYGIGDPGIFFFTADGVMIETSLDYIQSDAPINIDVPRLG